MSTTDLSGHSLCADRRHARSARCCSPRWPRAPRTTRKCTRSCRVRNSGTARRMNLHGFVVDGSIEKRPNSLDYRFKVKNGDQTVTATYTGTVPDTFKDGAEVVLTGTLASDGFHVKRNGVTAKCPSRYDPDQQGRLAHPRVTSGQPRLVSPARGVRHRERRVRGVLRGRQAPPERPDPRRHRPLPRRHRDHARRVGGHGARVRHRRLHHSIRPALLEYRAAALLQAGVVLGRARRLDHVLGHAARRVRQRRRCT